MHASMQTAVTMAMYRTIWAMTSPKGRDRLQQPGAAPVHDVVVPENAHVDTRGRVLRVHPVVDAAVLPLRQTDMVPCVTDVRLVNSRVDGGREHLVDAAARHDIIHEEEGEPRPGYGAPAAAQPARGDERCRERRAAEPRQESPAVQCVRPGDAGGPERRPCPSRGAPRTARGRPDRPCGRERSARSVGACRRWWPRPSRADGRLPPG